MIDALQGVAIWAFEDGKEESPDAWEQIE